MRIYRRAKYCISVVLAHKFRDGPVPPEHRTQLKHELTRIESLIAESVARAARGPNDRALDQIVGATRKLR